MCQSEQTCAAQGPLVVNARRAGLREASCVCLTAAHLTSDGISPTWGYTTSPVLLSDPRFLTDTPKLFLILSPAECVLSLTQFAQLS